MTDSATSERAEYFRKLCKEAAAQFRMPEDSERVKHVATYRMARDIHAERMIAGATPNPEYLARLDEILQRYMPEATSAAAEQVGGIVIQPFVLCALCRCEVHPTPEPEFRKPKPFEPPDPLLLPPPVIDGGDDD
jgi:hypothetical protein